MWRTPSSSAVSGSTLWGWSKQSVAIIAPSEACHIACVLLLIYSVYEGKLGITKSKPEINLTVQTSSVCLPRPFRTLQLLVNVSFILISSDQITQFNQRERLRTKQITFFFSRLLEFTRDFNIK